MSPIYPQLKYSILQYLQNYACYESKYETSYTEFIYMIWQLLVGQSGGPIENKYMDNNSFQQTKQCHRGTFKDSVTHTSR